MAEQNADAADAGMTHQVTRESHGGRRPGVGRPRLFPEEVIQVTVTLQVSQLGVLRALGDGSLSRGIARLPDSADLSEGHGEK